MLFQRHLFWLLALVLPLWCQTLSAQQHPSIHQIESTHYKSHKIVTQTQSPSVLRNDIRIKPTKMVFGYHPYWMNDSWGGYDWSQLTDICYFSYEVNPETGKPLTMNGFENATLLDSARKHHLNIHLCITLFSSHSQFLSNITSQDTLILRLSKLVGDGVIQGINIDFEAVPSSQREKFTAFITRLSETIKGQTPGAFISIASPAVNWNNTFDLKQLSTLIDFFMVMCYDYYWNGSAVAGPVSGLYPLESGYNYSVSRTLKYYLSEVTPDKIVMGVPYYGRTWPTGQAQAPTATLGNGVALMYSTIKNDAQGFYSWNTAKFDLNSRSQYYGYQANGWNQCFTDTYHSLALKYDVALGLGLRGIGIWALGYDNGHQELWDLLSEKFSSANGMLCTDTICDPGGSLLDSPFDAQHVFTISPSFGGPIKLDFIQLELDGSSFSIYDGPDTLAPLLASVINDDLPQSIQSTGEALTLKLIPGTGNWPEYCFVWNCASAGIETLKPKKQLSIYPNPVRTTLQLQAPKPIGNRIFQIYDCMGRQAVKGLVPQNGVIDIQNLNLIPNTFYIINVLSITDAYSTKFLYLP